MVFVLIDGRHTPQKIDLEFLEQLKKWQVPFCLIFTKTDKENQRTVSKNVKDFFRSYEKNLAVFTTTFCNQCCKKNGKR